MKLRVRREAELDVLESAIWYNDAEVGLGEAFVDPVQERTLEVSVGLFTIKQSMATLGS